ncbi:abl interactor 2-like [Paramacrobiotus metropolitanus]|uniref:abl interactor 2-like n=1 Tax=Paramacrobiotus metropolitanus TaxID=2943436 RepID=UPI0024456206|nr:abl interactor 2-like [Paramacrobiotus metropolitanus]
MAEHPMYTIMDQDIPEAQESLRSSHVNLEQVARYCKVNYIQAEDKRHALDETKNYATQALASVAYQINAFSYHLMQLFDHQDVQLAEMESQLRHVDQNVMVHKEKIARREIGALATTNKPMQRQQKFLQPPHPERAIRYVRKPIDYSVLDDVGHGIKTSATPQQPRAAPATVRKTGSTLTDTSSMSSGPSSTYDTAAIYRKTGVTAGGTLSRGGGPPGSQRNASDYRAPVPPPPPVVPPIALPAAAVHGAGAKQYVSAAPTPSQTHRGGDYFFPPGSAVPQRGAPQPPPPPAQPSPVPGSAQSHYASQKQMFQFPATGAGSMSSPRKLSTGSNGGYGGLPLSNGHGSNHHLPYHTNIHSPLPPPPPPVDGAYGNGIPSSRTSYNGSMGRAAGMMVAPVAFPSASANANAPASRTSLNGNDHMPPLPPPPPEPMMLRNGYADGPLHSVHMHNGQMDWTPKIFLEKVVAIYDYQADKDDELSFNENQVIYVVKKNDDGWYEGVMEPGLRGLFPGNYVEPCG